MGRRPRPLVGEHREHDLVAPLALEHPIAHQVSLLAQAQPGGQADRGLVATVEASYYPMQPEFGEAQSQYRRARFAGVAAAAGIGMNT